MQIRVLGCSGSIGGECRTTAFLLDADVLIDAGTGVGDLTLDELCKVDHILISHSHLDHVLSIGGVEVAAFFRELGDGRYRVSLRSKGKLDVAHVAETFGGGGHECASGCSVDGPLTDAVHQILARIRRGSSVQ